MGLVELHAQGAVGVAGVRRCSSRQSTHGLLVYLFTCCLFVYILFIYMFLFIYLYVVYLHNFVYLHVVYLHTVYYLHGVCLYVVIYKLFIDLHVFIYMLFIDVHGGFYMLLFIYMVFSYSHGVCLHVVYLFTCCLFTCLFIHVNTCGAPRLEMNPKLLPSRSTFCLHHTTVHQFTLSLYSKPHT